MLPFDQLDFRTFLQVGDQPRTQLKYYPDWKDLGFAFIRDPNTHAIVAEVSLSKVRFVGEDAHIIRKALYDLGFNAKVRFTIEMLDRDEKTPSPTLYQYQPLFTGVIVMTSIEDEHVTDTKGAEFIDAESRPDALYEEFMNNLDKSYEIKPYTKKLLYDRLVMENRGGWIYSEGSLLLYDGDNNSKKTNHATLGVTALGDGEQPAGKMIFVQQNQGTPLEWGNLAENYFARDISPSNHTVNVRVRLKGYIDAEVYTWDDGRAGDNYSFYYYIRLYKNDTSYIMKSGFLGVVSGDKKSTVHKKTEFDFDYDRNILAQDGDTFRVVFSCSAGYDAHLPDANSASTSQVTVKPTIYIHATEGENNVEVTYSARNENQLSINVADSISFIKQLCDKAAGVDTSVVDEDSMLSRLVFTSTGAMCENGEDAIVSASLNDCLSSLRKILGFGYNFMAAGGDGKPVVSIKPLAKFYPKNTKIGHVWSAHNLQIKPYENAIFNRVEVGYDGLGEGETNDIDEFNCKMEFALNNIYSNKAINLVSKYRADMYGFENIARQILEEEKKTTSTSAYTDVWLIDADKSSSDMYKLYRGSELVATYLAAGGSAFNVFLSPKRILFRNAGLIAGAVYPYDEQSVLATYVSSERQTKMRQTIDGVEQKERGNLENKGLSRLFQPFLFTFYTHYDVQLISKIKSNPYGYVEFDWEGITLKGFIYEKVEVFPSTKKEIEWKLIAHPDMDMATVLTRYVNGRLPLM